MLIQKYLENRVLNPKPFLHIALVESLIRWDYAFPRKTRIIIENPERLPRDRAAIIAMNHTNPYNYIPFLYQLYREYQADSNRPFPSYGFWSKARFFHNPVAGRLLAAGNVLPLPSRGYVLAKDFKDTCGRVPDDREYRLLRDLVDETIDQAQFLAQANVTLKRFVTTPHAAFDPAEQLYADYVEAQFETLMQMVTSISERGLLEQGINILIFPEGGVSVRLQSGQVGLAQLALKTGAPIVPVAGNGLDRLYPDLRPFSQGGEAIYRVGKPLTLEGELAPVAINEPFEPFTRAARDKYNRHFQAVTGLVMARLNELLDPPYQFSLDAAPPARKGAERFV